MSNVHNQIVILIMLFSHPTLFGEGIKLDAFARKPKSGWLGKKRQMQGAQLSRNEAYLGTPQ
jgi:hypothetical protein